MNLMRRPRDGSITLLLVCSRMPGIVPCVVQRRVRILGGVHRAYAKKALVAVMTISIEHASVCTPRQFRVVCHPHRHRRLSKYLSADAQAHSCPISAFEQSARLRRKEWSTCQSPRHSILLPLSLGLALSSCLGDLIIMLCKT